MIVRGGYRALPTIGNGLGQIPYDPMMMPAGLLGRLGYDPECPLCGVPGSGFPAKPQTFEEMGAQVVEEAKTWTGGPFVEPTEYSIVLPGGVTLRNLSTANVEQYKALAAETPGGFQSIIATAAQEAGYSQAEANTMARDIVLKPEYKVSQQASSGGGMTQYYPRVSLSNLSRPGQPLQVDDEFLLQIGGGRPDAPVTATATQNGSTSTSDFGRTDAGGFLQVRGRMSAAEIGQWQETWRVGPEEASPRLSFSVAAKPAAGAATTGGAAANGGAAADGAAATAPAILEQLKALPWWLWAALAGGIVLLRRA